MILNLKESLAEVATEADELWIAVALVNEAGFDALQLMVKASCKQHYLVGIDLPTRPTVLRAMMDLQGDMFVARICKQTNTYHPKVYIFRKGDKYVAFVGSANLTGGGLERNTEMTWKVTTTEDCQQLIGWFTKQFSHGYPLTEENVSRYETVFTDNAAEEATIARRRRSLQLVRPSSLSMALAPYLDTITDFEQRFFKREHFWAFRKANAKLQTADANRERYVVMQRLLDLHELIYPQFVTFGLTDLFKHYNDQFITSSYVHREGFTSDELLGMWLHYSKEEAEIRAYERQVYGTGRQLQDGERNEMSFANQMRLQVIILSRSVGVWLYVGKENNGSPFDRQRVQEMLHDSAELNIFFDHIHSLPSGYHIKIADEKIACSEVRDSAHLREIWSKDSARVRSYIGIDFEAHSAELLTRNFPGVVLTEFQRLYPLYQLMRDRRFAITKYVSA